MGDNAGSCKKQIPLAVICSESPRVAEVIRPIVFKALRDTVEQFKREFEKQCNTQVKYFKCELWQFRRRNGMLFLWAGSWIYGRWRGGVPHLSGGIFEHGLHRWRNCWRWNWWMKCFLQIFCCARCRLDSWLIQLTTSKTSIPRQFDEEFSICRQSSHKGWAPK